MSKQNEALKSLEWLLAKIETDTKRAKLMIHNMLEWNPEEAVKHSENLDEMASKLLSYEEWEDVKVVEWVYDGYFMIGSDEKKYPVPMNYSSKTKLIPGDVMKLRVLPDGKLVYKLIWPAPRSYIKATLSRSDENKYIAITDEWQVYQLNQAAITFFKWKPGNELSIIINPESTVDMAAIEAIISN